MTQHAQPREIFGATKDGQSVYRVQLTGGGLSASIITWGAALQDLRLDGHKAPLVLGFDNFDDYPAHSPYFGAIPGRVANRIGNAKFKIDGKNYKVDANINGKHTLHGGTKGIGKRNWQIADLGTSHVDLTLTDPDGTMGFPGTCEMTCSYVLKDDGILHISLTTRSDAPTIANLTHHSYFNLDGGSDNRDHTVQIFADNITEVDSDYIPTGKLIPVEGTAHDFRTPKRIGQDLTDDTIYDHNFCLANERRNLQDVAMAHSDKSGITMNIATTEPGLQFYAGHKVSTPAGLMGEPYKTYSGFCFEAQNWPDAINQKDFPNAILRPDEELRQITEYRFSKNT
ncbi:MAG: aldose epimerase family protein [Rhizobiaceae bacterium]